MGYNIYGIPSKWLRKSKVSTNNTKTKDYCILAKSKRLKRTYHISANGKLLIITNKLMTKDDLKDQLWLYWIINFKAYYGVAYYTVQDNIGLQWGKRWQERPDFPHDDLTHKERNKIFWDALWMDSKAHGKMKKRDDSLAETKRIVREYVEPIPEPYVWPFSQFMNRF